MYKLSNLTTSPVSVDNISLKQGESKNALFKSTQVISAENSNLISVARVGTQSATIDSLNAYIGTLVRTLPAQVL